jgi:hypothetical protein
MAQATVQLSLNLRYTDPADPSEGGKWWLVAKTDDTDGIAAISAYLSNVQTIGAAYGNGTGAGASAYATTTASTIGAITNGGNPYIGVFNGVVNLVYGQDLASGPIVADVGQGAGTPGNTGLDPLRHSNWNNAAVIATGMFAGGGNSGNQFNRPAFVPSGSNSTDANTLQGTTLGVPSVDANVTMVVRGDSLGSMNLNSAPGQGLLRGDVNRDFIVNEDDLNLVLLRFQDGPGLGWDVGDVNDDGWVDENDLNQVLLHFADASAPPGISAAIAPASEAIGAAAPTPDLGGDFDGNGQVDGSDWLLWQRGQSPVPLSAGDLATWQSDYGAGNEVAAVAAPLAGDFNGDGEVSGPDLAIWRPSFIARNANGDADGDGDTDGGDILIWQREIGQPAASASISAVPEPHAVGLMILGAFTLSTGCRRRRLQPN